MRRNLGSCFGIVLATGLMMAASASAGFINASATIVSSVEADGVTYDYTITLKESATATDSIGTFWFAWLPAQDYMTNIPISVINPARWKATITHGPGFNGYAIQWTALTSASFIPVGGSRDFGFRSLETPGQLLGNSPFFPGTPEMTSVVYNAAPFSADTQTFLVTPGAAVPEPSALVLSLVGGLTAVAGRRIGRRNRA